MIDFLADDVAFYAWCERLDLDPDSPTVLEDLADGYAEARAEFYRAF